MLAATVAALAVTVPRGDVLAADGRGRMTVVDSRGHTLARARGVLGAVQGIAVAPDRRHAYVSVYVRGPSRLWLVDLGTGRKRFVAPGLSPAVSPDGTRLAYFATAVKDQIKWLTRLVVADLASGRRQTYALPPRTPVGTPPELVLSWSPDSRSLALYDGAVARILAAPRRGALVSRRVVGRRLFSTAYVDPRTLVVDGNCCIGGQRLLAIDLRTGSRRAFARVSSPPETAVRLRDGVLVVSTALNELVVVSRGRAKVIAHDVTAASP